MQVQKDIYLKDSGTVMTILDRHLDIKCKKDFLFYIVLVNRMLR